MIVYICIFLYLQEIKDIAGYQGLQGWKCEIFRKLFISSVFYEKKEYRAGFTVGYFYW